MKKKKFLMYCLMASVATSTVAVMTSCGGTTPNVTAPSTNDITTATKQFTGIEVTGGKTQYVAGEEFSKDGFKVVAKYSTNEEEDVTAKATFDTSKINTKKEGSYVLVVTYNNKTASVNITVTAAPLASIELDIDSVKQEFVVGDSLSTKGLKVIATYTDNSTKEFTKDFTAKVYDKDNNEVSTFEASGEYNVVVEFGGMTKEYTITVDKASFETVEEAVEGVVANDDKVNGGTFAANYVNSDNYSYESDYSYGENFVKVATRTNVKSGESTSVAYNDQYFSTRPDGKVFGVSVDKTKNEDDTFTENVQLYETRDDWSKLRTEDGGINKNASKKMYFTKVLDGSLISGTDSAGSFGAGNFINYLFEDYSLTKHGQASDSKGKCPHLDNEDGYMFSYNLLYNNGTSDASGNYYFRRVTVEFVTNDFGALEKAYVKVEQFQTENVVTDLNNLPEELAGITVSKDGDTNIFTVSDDKTTDKYIEYTITQTTGEKAKKEENPYTIDKVMIAGFTVWNKTLDCEFESEYNLDLDNGNTEINDEKRNKFIYEYEIRNTTPETADKNLDKVEVTISGTSKDGYELTGDSWADMTYASASKTSIAFGRPGDYVVTFKSYNVIKKITFHIDYEAPHKIAASIYDKDETDNFVKADSHEMYLSNSLYIKGNILDNYNNETQFFDPNYTVEVTSGPEGATLTPVDNVNGYDCFEFKATAAGTYVVTVKGAKSDKEGVSEATATLTIVVKENPEVSEILTDSYDVTILDEKYKVEFIAAEGENKPQVKFTKVADETVEVLNYTYADGKFNLFHESGSEFKFKLELTGKYVLVVKSEGNSYICYRPGTSPEDLANVAKLLSGKYTVYISMADTTFTINFEPTEGTNGVMTVSDGDKSSTYEYKYNASTKRVDKTLKEGKDIFSGVILVTDDGLLYDFFGGVLFEKAKVDLSAILSGKYTLVDDSNYNYELEFADGKVTIVNTTKNKTGVFTYAFNEETGFLTLTLAKGETSKILIYRAMYIIDGELQYVSNKMNGDGTFTKVHRPFIRVVEALEIPEEVLGRWYDENGIEFKFTEDGILENEGFKYTLIEINGNDYKFVDDTGYEILITIENGVVIINDQELSRENEQFEFDTRFDGVWYQANGSFYTIHENVYEFYDATNEATITFTSYEFDGDTLTLNYIGGFPVTLTITGEALSDGEVEYTKSNETATVSIPDGFIGRWDDGVGSIFVITENSVTVNGKAIEFKIVDGKLVVNIDGQSFTLSVFDENTLFDDSDYSYNRINGEDVSIPEDFQGKWVCADGYIVVINIKESSITFDDEPVNVLEVGENSITVDAFGNTQTLTLSEAGITYNSQLYTLSTGSEEGGEEEAPSYINQDMIGTWVIIEEGEIISELVIGEHYVDLNGFEGTIEFYEDGSAIIKLGDSYVFLTLNDGVLSVEIGEDTFTYTKVSK